MRSFFLDIGAGTGDATQGRAWLMDHFAYVIIILVFTGAVIGVVWFFSKFLKDYKNSPAYIEKQKNKPTSLADLKDAATKAKLSDDERKILSEMIHNHRTPNIRFLLRDFPAFDALLRETYSKIKESGNVNKLTSFFLTRQKCLNTFSEEIPIKNSRALEPGTKFTYTADKGIHYILILKEFTQDGMALEISEKMLANNEKPKSLDKVSFVFISKYGTPYNIETRIVRYQEGKMGLPWLIVTNSEKLFPLQKRASDRIDINDKCKFASVVSAAVKNKTVYRPNEKRYEAMLVDVSAGGCRLETNLPIKAEQNIYIEGKFNKNKIDSAIGVILRTTKRRDNIFVLHIKFIDIANDVVNRIYELACGYENAVI